MVVTLHGKVLLFFCNEREEEREMKKLSKKLLLILLCMTFLVGCGQSATSATAKSLELTMYFPVSVGGGPDALIDALCEEYHKINPNVKINPVYAGSYADTRTKVQAAIKGGNTPDMAIMFSIDLYSLLAMDAIADINQFCTTDQDKEWLNGFYEGFTTLRNTTCISNLKC